MSIDPRNSEAEAQVRQHNENVGRSGANRTCYGEFCARCQASGPFAPYDVRRRGLRIALKDAVLLMTVWLARWRCRKCRYVFTDYPDFRTPVQAIRCLVAAEPGSELRRAGWCDLPLYRARWHCRSQRLSDGGRQVLTGWRCPASLDCLANLVLARVARYVSP